MSNSVTEEQPSVLSKKTVALSTPQPMGDVVVVFGSTGQCGKHILENLLQSPEIEHVYSFVRRPTSRFQNNSKHHEIVLTDLHQSLPPSTYNERFFPHQRQKDANGVIIPFTPEQLRNDQLLSALEFDLRTKWPQEHVDVVFSGLATTLKQAGSEDNMFTIDYKMNDLIATYAKEEKQVESYYLISSVSANSSSNIFYMRLKGLLDDRINGLNFHHSKVYRPGILIGAQRPDFRLGEWVLETFIAPIYPTSCCQSSYFGRIAPIDVKDVGQSMVYDYFQYKYESQMNSMQFNTQSIRNTQNITKNAKTTLSGPITPTLHAIVEGSADIRNQLIAATQFLNTIDRKSFNHGGAFVSSKLPSQQIDSAKASL